MSDYISRKAAVKIAQEYGLVNGSALGRHTRLADRIAIEIDGLPAADVAEVRHVHRKVWGIDEYYGEWLRCPNCGYEDNTINAKYCGGCSAKMDLEGEIDDRKAT